MKNDQVRAWITDVLSLVHEGGVEQNIFRSALHARLSAVPLETDGRPAATLGDVIDEEVEVMRRTFPGFVPDIDRYARYLPCWPTAPYTSLERDLLRAA